jgi:hypothetical protein
MTRVTLPIILPRSFGGTRVIIVVMSSGIITAVPLAWTTRAMSRTEKLGARVAIAVPVRNKLMARAYAVRVVTRWRNHPVAGMTTAMVSMKAVESHWALVAGTANSRISRGIALTMIVSLRMTTKVDRTRIRMTRLTLTSGVSAASV